MKAHIVCIIDRSGSMGAILDDAIGGFNTFLEQQKSVEGEASMTFVQFDSEYEKVLDRKPLNDVQPLTRSTYTPRGTTALLDAVGRTLNSVENNSCSKCGEKVIVAILTDGAENASREYSREQVRKLVDSKREDGWEFIYLGANQDAFAEAGTLGINLSDTVNFKATGSGIRSAYDNMSSTVTSYRQ